MDMSYLMHLSGGVTRHAIGDYECNSHVPLADFVKLVDTRGRRRGSRWFLCGVVFIDGWRCGSGHMETDSIRAEAAVPSLVERHVQEGCSSAVEFSIGSSPVTIRRSCGVALGEAGRDVLCIGDGAAAIELVRMDRIEWGGVRKGAGGRSVQRCRTDDDDVAKRVSGRCRWQSGFVSRMDRWRLDEQSERYRNPNA